MSDLADKLAAVDGPPPVRMRRGPSNLCDGVYQPDLEDWEAIEEFRRRPGQSWQTAQIKVDALAGLSYPAIPNDKFRYHWRRKCWCWPDDLRMS